MYDKENNRLYQKKWYKKNKKLQIERSKKSKEKIRDWYIEYKKQLTCIKCDESDYRCLDFHHKSNDKTINICQAVRNGWCIESIKQEIKKCDPLCANCHRKLTIILR